MVVWCGDGDTQGLVIERLSGCFVVMQNGRKGQSCCLGFPMEALRNSDVLLCCVAYFKQDSGLIWMQCVQHLARVPTQPCALVNSVLRKAD